MQVQAQIRDIRISPRKLRLIADSIRGLSFVNAGNALSVMSKRASNPMYKTLYSAASNAVAKGMNKDNLVIKSIEVTEGTALKRYHPSSRGRVHPYKKRGSHVRIILEEKNGTKS